MKSIASSLIQVQEREHLLEDLKPTAMARDGLEKQKELAAMEII